MLKNLRQPPLLNTHGEDCRWMALTPEDVPRFRRLLRGVRDYRWNCGEHVARAHHYMMKAGVHEPITEADRKAIGFYLQGETKGSMAICQLATYYYAKQLGLTDVLGPEYLRGAEIAFRNTMAAEKEAHNAEKPDYGRMLARAYHYAQGIGLDLEIEGQDMRAIRDAMEYFRKEGNGIGIAEMHAYMRGFGGLGSVTASDLQTMRKTMEKNRREGAGGEWTVAEMHSLLPDIQADMKVKRQEMPPVKRFGGGK